MTDSPSPVNLAWQLEESQWAEETVQVPLSRHHSAYSCHYGPEQIVAPKMGEVRVRGEARKGWKQATS